MTASFSNLKPGRFEPPLRRVLAVDAGSRSVRLLLLESRFGRLRVVNQDVMDLQEEGLVSPEEIRAHLRKTLDDWGRPPVALALPQHVAVSQSIDLPAGSESDSRKLIEAETIKVAGVSESAIVYDFVRVPSSDSNRHRHWVTFCQEVEIQSRITQLGLDDEEFREITTAANGLLAAWHINQPQKRDVILIHAEAQSTTIVIMVNGAGVFATSFPTGGDFFTRAIARSRKIPDESAETLKRSDNLLEGDNRLAELAEAVNGWATELKRHLNDWRQQQRSGQRDLSKFEYFASGAVFEQPGLLDYLKTSASLKLERWPANVAPDAVLPTTGFEIALGTALQALGQSPQPVSLLPAERRAAWKSRLGRQRLEFASCLVLAVVFLALAFGIWQKISLIRQKRALLVKVEASRTDALNNERLTADLLAGFDTLRPLFERQQNTTDILQTLSSLQHARTNRPFWYVLLADQQSYFTQPLNLTTTNKPGSLADLARIRASATTNLSAAKPGCIAELCIPEDPDGARRTLSAVVSDLKKDSVFARVDLLSEDLRRNLADPKVILPEKHFALALDFATTEFQRPVAMRKNRSLTPARTTLRPTPPADVDEP